LTLQHGRGKRPELGRGSHGLQRAQGPKGADLHLPGFEGAIKKSFPEAPWELCILDAVRDVLNKVRKKNRNALAEALKKDLLGRDTEESDEALRGLRERWDIVYSELGALGEQRLMPLGFPASFKTRSPLLYITNQSGRLAKEIKRRTKVVEVFCGKGAVVKLLYLVLSQLDEARGARRLRGFVEIQIGNYHVALTH